MNEGPLDWDAETYDRVSDPQYEWGIEVLERLELAGDETVLDAGAGSGRVTKKLIERVSSGRVIAADGSPSMIEKARQNLGESADYLLTDLAELELDPPVDVVFSTATFHWIVDHENLFRRIQSALKPRGRLHAQCGGAGNVASHTRAIAEVATSPEFLPHFEGMEIIWNFAGAEETEERLAAAGFTEIRCWLEPKPITPEKPSEFMRTVTLGPHLSYLPQEKRDPFVRAVLERSEEPVTLDYVRLNIEAVRPA